MLKALEKCGVHVYHDHILAQWNDGAEDVTEISSAQFTTNKQPLRLECGVSIYCALLSRCKLYIKNIFFKAWNMV